jgi:hypothetical protein
MIPIKDLADIQNDKDDSEIEEMPYKASQIVEVPRRLNYIMLNEEVEPVIRVPTIIKNRKIYSEDYQIVTKMRRVI